jgi:hypothetical protein
MNHVSSNSKQSILSQTFAPYGAADVELEWFFTMAACDVGLRSNFLEVLHPTLVPSAEDRVEALRAQRIIERRLSRLSAFDAGVLQAAYVARPWPVALRETMGRSTGVLVRLAAAEAVDGHLPQSDTTLDALERRVGETLTLQLAQSGLATMSWVHAKASVLLRQAFAGYVTARGGGAPKALRGGV